MAFSVATGTYTGNATDPTTISGVGFQPDSVWVQKEPASFERIWRSTTMVAGESFISNSATILTDGIKSFTADGFVIGDDTRVNGDGLAYHYLAIKGEAGVCHFGTYAGTGVDQDITGVGFAPDIVTACGRGLVRYPMRTTSLGAGDTTLKGMYSVGAALANYIEELQADGFNVGTNAEINLNGYAYHYMAMINTVGQVFEGTYTSDGTDDRNIVMGDPFQPDFVWVRGDFNAKGVLRHGHNATENSFKTAGNGAAGSFPTNLIQAMTATGFQVGTGVEVNWSTATEMYYVAIKGAAAAGGAAVAKRHGRKVASTQQSSVVIPKMVVPSRGGRIGSRGRR